MSVLLISYELNPNKDRKKLDGILNLLQEFKGKKLIQNSYYFMTEETPEQIYEHFKPHLDDEDVFTVVTVTHPSFFYYRGQIEKSGLGSK